MKPSWDERYRKRPTRSQPSAFLTEFEALIPRAGLALDLACGGGRNTVYLAQRGLHAIGVDRSLTGLEQGREMARQKKVWPEWILADLERFALRPHAVDLIVCTYYREPGLYSTIRQTLRPGGLLFYRTFTLEQLKFDSGPRNPAHLLQPNELFNVFCDWHIIFYDEKCHGQGLSTMVARKPAA